MGGYSLSGWLKKLSAIVTFIVTPATSKSLLGSEPDATASSLSHAKGEMAQSKDFFKIDSVVGNAARYVEAMVSFRNDIIYSGKFHKGKICSICFDPHMEEHLNKDNEKISGKSYGEHYVPRDHTLEDPKVWHRPFESDDLPLFIHADSVCTNTNFVNGVCRGNTTVRWANNNSNEESLQRCCYRAHCMKKTHDGETITTLRHLSRVVCPHQFNMRAHNKNPALRKFGDKCAYYHFEDSEKARKVFKIFMAGMIALCPDYWYSMSTKDLFFLFGCYMDLNGFFRDEKAPSYVMLNMLGDMLFSRPSDVHEAWYFIFEEDVEKVKSTYMNLFLNINDYNPLDKDTSRTYDYQVWDPKKMKDVNAYLVRPLGFGNEKDSETVTSLNFIADSIGFKKKIKGYFGFFELIVDAKNIGDVLVTDRLKTYANKVFKKTVVSSAIKTMDDLADCIGVAAQPSKNDSWSDDDDDAAARGSNASATSGIATTASLTSLQRKYATSRLYQSQKKKTELTEMPLDKEEVPEEVDSDQELVPDKVYGLKKSMPDKRCLSNDEYPSLVAVTGSIRKTIHSGSSGSSGSNDSPAATIKKKPSAEINDYADDDIEKKLSSDGDNISVDYSVPASQSKDMMVGNQVVSVGFTEHGDLILVDHGAKKTAAGWEMKNYVREDCTINSMMSSVSVTRISMVLEIIHDKDDK